MKELALALAPCPFCGAKDTELQQGTCDREGYPVNLACVECGATGPWVYAPADDTEIQQCRRAADEWNRRA